MPPVGFIAASGGSAVGTAFSFAVPSSAKVGDSLIAIVAMTDAGLSLSSTDFSTLAHLTSSRGQMWILRHVVVDGEVAVLTATASGTPTKGAGAMLLYRGLDGNAAAGASSSAAV
ncbi:MAG TPA: hypothetical protein VLT45_07935, partial [Kofleriaceae bacterium]|nr:hypothetical protein [Kofleriaceae bacterium]